MGTLLTVLFCLLLIGVFIALVGFGILIAVQFGEGLANYMEDWVEEFFERKKKRDFKIKVKRYWNAQEMYVVVDLYGVERQFDNVDEMVAWLKEQGVE